MSAMKRETYLRRPDLGRRLASDSDISRSDQSPQDSASGPCCVCLQGRVALGDDAGVHLAPRVGRTDAERNGVSNIRPKGPGYEAAARRIDWIAAVGVARGGDGGGVGG